MPAAMEKKLKKVARSLLTSGKLQKEKGETAQEAMARFVYGTMRHQMGWKPGMDAADLKKHGMKGA